MQRLNLVSLMFVNFFFLSSLIGLSAEEKSDLALLEERLDADNERTVHELLQHPSKDPEFEKKFFKFTSKYQSYYGLTYKAEHFNRLWTSFWKTHITEKKRKELSEKKRLLRRDFLNQRKAKDDYVKNILIKEMLKNNFSPNYCSSPKTSAIPREVHYPAAGAPATSNHNGERDRILISSLIPNSTKQTSEKEFLNLLELSQASDEELLESGSTPYSPISENSVLCSPAPSRGVECPGGAASVRRDLEAKIERAVLSLSSAIATSSHLTGGFRHLVASFDNQLSVAKNIEKALEEEDNVILFLIIKDRLEFLLEKNTESAVRKKIENGLKECKEILRIIPKNIDQNLLE